MTINIAILGPGRIAENSLAPAVARVDGIQLWSVLSRDRERAAACGEVVKVRSVINNRVWGSPHDETAAVCVQFENGSTAEICTSVLFDAPRRMEVYGSDGHAL